MQYTLCSFCRKCCAAVECVGAFPLSLIGNSSSRTIDPMNELIKSIGSMEAEKEEG